MREIISLNAVFLSTASVVGHNEAEGPLGRSFDMSDESDLFGCKTWEAAESEMHRRALECAISKSGFSQADIGALFAGDLLNQCVGSAYGLMDFDIPYFGLYGACSTCGEGLLLAASFVTSGIYDCCAAVTSSHYCAAERQYRTPLEYGSQRPPTAQWTVTGAGAFLVGAGDAVDSADNLGVRICRALPGKVVEMGIRDANNMGAAMAPAAHNTLLRFFAETGKRPDDFDLIVTGDLGFEGGAILLDMLRSAGYDLRDHYMDCGQLIYYRKEQDVHGGGSGCGCSAVVLASKFLPEIAQGRWKRMLFLPTGAMMSPDSIKQGRSIPAIAHLLELERMEKR